MNKPGNFETMTSVVKAYRQTWSRRGVVIPIFLAVRLLSLLIIVPLTAAFATFVINLSGQSALIDQDIAYFMFTPIGFPAFLAISIIVLIGSVIGLATMTVDLQGEGNHGLAAFWNALQRIGGRLPRLANYGARLVLRVLVIVLPFLLVGFLIYQWLLGAFDINYYLHAKPPDLYLAAALIGSLLMVMTLVLLNRLLLWAVSLHLVLFADLPPQDVFTESARRMSGKRLALLRDLGIWFAVRAGAALLLAIVFGWLLRHATDDFGAAFRVKLAVSIIFAVCWSVCGFIVSAISIGALARILSGYYGAQPRLQPDGTRLLTRNRVLIGGAVLIGVTVVLGAMLVSRVQLDNEVEIIAHRGAAGARPENTLASVRKAVEDGADWVEIDVQETADGEIVVMHDSDFMKLAGVDLKIWDASLEDLQDIDIGSWFAADYAQERTPKLSDVLEVVRGKSKLLIELKYYGHDVDLESRTIALVEAAGMVDQVATMSLKYPAVQKMKALRPGWPAGVLAATAIGNLAGLDADFIAVNAAMAGPRLLREVHKQGKKLYVWTVNDPLSMSAMMSIGVDGIITDEPALARSVLRERAELNTVERVFILFVERFGLTLPEEKYRDDSP
jgi:glycerophosphoryl diester phosphodiesterase